MKKAKKMKKAEKRQISVVLDPEYAELLEDYMKKNNLNLRDGVQGLMKKESGTQQEIAKSESDQEYEQFRKVMPQKEAHVRQERRDPVQEAYLKEVMRQKARSEGERTRAEIKRRDNNEERRYLGKPKVDWNPTPPPTFHYNMRSCTILETEVTLQKCRSCEIANCQYRGVGKLQHGEVGAEENGEGENEGEQPQTETPLTPAEQLEADIASWEPVDGYEKNMFLMRADGSFFCPYKGVFQYPRECKETCKKVFPTRFEACRRLQSPTIPVQHNQKELEQQEEGLKWVAQQNPKRREFLVER